MYKLSLEAESGTIKIAGSNTGGQGGIEKPLPKSPNWYAAPFQKIKRGSRLVTTSRKETDSDSEKSLRVQQNDFDATQSSSDERSMQIMVERSFFVTDAERKSYVDQDLNR